MSGPVSASFFGRLVAPGGVAEPLRHRVFRRIWLASLMSNLGILIQGVAAAWAMTELTSSPDMVALVQTALMLPFMLSSLAAGAVADMYDRRIVSLTALMVSLVGATAMSVTAFLGLLTPPLLLFFCFAVGTGMALFGPSWAASVSEQVPPEVLPSAIALNSISFNIARSFGPALGGAIVATLGVAAGFFVNATCYIPILFVLYLWRRAKEPARLPPENLGRAMVLGVRYLVFAPAIHVVLARTLVTGLLGGATSALMPLIARDTLGGGATTFGVLLGAFGLGAVAGALAFEKVRNRLGSEMLARASAVVMALAVAGVALSRNELLTSLVLIVAGAAWMIVVTLFNIGVQLAAPRWVAGRALAAFQASIAGGIALGSWGWGWVAQHTSVEQALLISAAAMLASPILGIWLRMPELSGHKPESEASPTDVEVRLAVKPRSGPIVVEVEYVVELDQAREFYQVMLEVQAMRRRNGAYGWTLARDIAQPELWIERFQFPTWLDFLRHRDRPTQAEREVQARAWEFHRGSGPPKIRRMLERPFGSVRWQDASPDRGVEVVPMIPTSSGH